MEYHTATSFVLTTTPILHVDPIFPTFKFHHLYPRAPITTSIPYEYHALNFIASGTTKIAGCAISVLYTVLWSITDT